MDVMDIRYYCDLMATYNATANRTLYDCCAQLSDDARTQDKGAFFGSIHATLNHIIVADDIWMARFKGEAVPHASLDTIVYDDFDPLQEGRVARDAAMLTFFKMAPDSFFKHDLSYHNMAGKAFSYPIRFVVNHFFNHQPHHRGQVHTLLSQAGLETPISDLIYLVKPQL
ncbi:DinB family protein [Kordiimonas pumila]|uniref:DinB family protein n=1 Tax=Kordiimonas pumila TaxID=2161677 RepID=A0ABV7D5M8_9PROT|nr:DinB family protein [Kordiimonas pumila]